MAQEIASLYAKIGVDTDALAAGLKQAGDMLRQTAAQFKQVEQSTPKLKAPSAAPYDAIIKRLMGWATGAISVAGAMKMIDTAVDLTMIGAQAQRLNNTFVALAGGTDQAQRAMEQLRAATQGTVSDMQLQMAASKFLAMGIAQTTDEAAQLTKMATQLGMAMGQDATTAAQDFALMLANQSIMRLDNFGISSGRVRQRIEELQKAFPGLTREAAFNKAVLEEGARAMERMGDQTKGLSGDIARLKSSTANIQANVGQTLAISAESGAGGLLKVAQYLERITAQSVRTGQATQQFAAQIRTLKDEGALTQDQADQLVRQFNALTLQLQRGKIDGVAFAAAVQQLIPSITGVSASIRSGASDWEIYQTSMNTAMEAFKGVADHMAAQAVRIGDALAQGIRSDSFQSALASIQQTVSQHNQAMENLQVSHAQALSDLEFNHNLERLQAEQRFQAQYAALMEAGRIADAERLKQKFRNENATAAANYEVRRQVQERSLLIQQIQQARSYQQQLAVQRDALLKSLIAQIEKARAENKIDAETAKAAIDIAAAQGSEQLRIEVETARRSLELADQWARGQIDARMMVIQAMDAVNKAQVDAGQAIKDLEAKLSGFKIKLPPLPPLDMSDIGGGVAVAAAVKEKTEPATRALSDVASDIERGIAAAKSAIKDLVKFELPEGVGAGLDKVGEFYSLAVAKFYAFIIPIKPQIAGIKDDLAPLNELAQVISAANQALGAINTERAMPNLDVWADRLVATLEYATNAIAYAAELIGKDKIKASAEIAGPFREILGIVGIDLSRLTLSEKFPDMAEWGNRFVLVIQHTTNAINYAAKLVGEDGLKAANDLSENMRNVLGVATIDFSKLALAKALPDMAEWGNRMVIVVQHAVSALQTARRLLGVDAMKEAAEASGAAREVLGLLSIDLSRIAMPNVGFQKTMEAHLQAVNVAIDAIVPMLRAVRARYTGEVLTEAAETAGAIKSITDVLNLGETFTQAAQTGETAKKPGAKYVPRRSFEVIIKNLRDGIEYLVPQMQDIGQQYGDALVEIQGTVTNIKAVFEALGSIAQAQTQIAEGEWDFSFLRTALRELGALFAGGAWGSLPPMPQPTWATGDNTVQGDAGRIRLELTMRLDENLVPTITTRVLEAVGTAQDLYLLAGNQGAV